MNCKLLFFVNVDWFFVSHRLPLALAAISQGYEVHLICNFTGKEKEIEGYGIKIHPINLSRARASIFEFLTSLIKILALFKKIDPDIVHLVTIKPVILGGIAARILGIQGVVAAVSGFGLVFIDRGIAAKIGQFAVKLLYMVALGGKNIKVIFQNNEDKNRLRGIIGIDSKKVELIRGSGVDLNLYKYMPYKDDVPIVMLPSRLLLNKGVLEFVHSAGEIRQRGYSVRFCLVGEIDLDNPASLTDEDIEGIIDRQVVEYWGFRSDMHNVLPLASIVVLPSYYGEGMPKILLEAAACGRPVITTNHPGCRDAIVPGVTGLLVPVKDTAALTRAIVDLLDHVDRRITMGISGRVLAEKEFGIQKVINKHMAIYDELR